MLYIEISADTFIITFKIHNNKQLSKVQGLDVPKKILYLVLFEHFSLAYYYLVLTMKNSEDTKKRKTVKTNPSSTEMHLLNDLFTDVSCMARFLKEREGGLPSLATSPSTAAD